MFISVLAKKLKKVLVEWTGPHMRTAGGHLVCPVGLCTEKIGIKGIVHAGTFIAPLESPREPIIGMDVL